MFHPFRLRRSHLLGGAGLSLVLVACGGSGGGGGGGGGPPGVDTPPTAVLNAPTTGALALKGDLVPITYTANDDGNAQCRLVVSVDASLATTGDNTTVFGPEVDANGVAVVRNAATASLAPGPYNLFLTVDDGVNPVASAALAGPFVVVVGRAGVPPTRSTAYGVRGSKVLLSVGEFEDGNLDRNGDGDTGDGVLAVVDGMAGTSAFLNAAFAAPPTPTFLTTDVTGIDGAGTARRLDNDGGLLFFPVREVDQGRSINGDADQTDTMFGWWDPASLNAGLHLYGGVRATGRAFGTKALVSVLESEEGAGGTTLNVDADTTDTVGGTIDTAFAGGTRFTVPRAATLPAVLALDGSFVAYKISEPNNGIDMNGDADIADNVIFVANVATNLQVGVAGQVNPPAGGRDTQVGAAFDVSPTSRVVYYVNEATAPAVDLNGDGDTLDNVPSQWNGSTGVPPFIESFPGVAAGVRLEAGNNPRFAVYQGTRFLYTSRELRTLGATDDNGDGDMLDTEVLRWSDDANPGVTNVLVPSLPGFPGLVGLALDGGQMAEVGAGFVSVVVQEAANGGLDLSGDGVVNSVLLLINTSATPPTVFNTGVTPAANGLIPVTGVKGPSGIVVSLPEALNGNLNGDADATDILAFYFSFGAPTTPVNLGNSAAVDVFLTGLRIGLIANESTNGTDYNGDGNFGFVFRCFSTAGVVEQTGLPCASTARVAADDGSLWAFLRNENVGTGEGRDLNGDGDTLDFVVGFWKP